MTNMTFSKYKYKPDDFKGIQFMADDLAAFYRSFETYRKEKAKSAWWELKDHWENLFFTIKHRELEGFLTQNTADDIRNYLEELADA